MLTVLALVAIGCSTPATTLAGSEGTQLAATADEAAGRITKATARKRAVDAAGSPAVATGPQPAAAAADTARKPAKRRQPPAPALPTPAGDDAELPPVEVSAAVSPTCVRPGGEVTITVATRPNAGVGFHAFYSDGQGGGPPPYGNSYGGNDGGLADAEGAYSETWTVAPTAPSGPGRVDVVVGHDGAFGNTSTVFAVADAVTGRCEQ